MIEFYLDEIKKAYKRNISVMNYLNGNHESNFKLISYIFCVEYVHRGSKMNKAMEFILAKFFNNYCVKRDFSLGPFQLKNSFCQNSNIKSVLELLDINKSSFIVDEFIVRNKSQLKIEEILKLYHSGNKNDNSFSSLMYVELFNHYCDYLITNYPEYSSLKTE